jgi:transposase
MALGKRKPVQQPLFVTVADLNVRSHPFYDAVNRVLDAHQFDPFVEELCAGFYDDGARGGRPGLAPGVYFRCLMVGYFEGIDSERGIDWRCNDSNALKLFLGLPVDKPAPDHSTISRTRRLIDLEAHAQVFRFVLKVLANHGLVDGTTPARATRTSSCDWRRRAASRRRRARTWPASTGSGRTRGPTTTGRARTTRTRRSRR